MMYSDGRFARRPCFRYFSLNTEMSWHALQAGRVYVRQHPEDARLIVDESHDIVGTFFSSCLIAMVDTYGL